MLQTSIPSSDPVDKLGIIAAIASISSIGIAIGLAFPLLSFILDARGFSSTIIGANAAMAGIASMAAVWLVTPMAGRFGVANSLIIAAIVASVSLIGFFWFDSIWAWFALRASFHGALTISFVLSEYWINSASAEKNRGLTLGIYATMLSFGFGIGPAILAQTGTASIDPFVIGSLILLASMIPIALARTSQPQLANAAGKNSGSSSAFLRFVMIVPLATGAVFVFGAVEQSILPLMPVYGQRIGFAESEVAYLLVAIAAGNVCVNIPIGILSDRLPDRRWALYFCALIGVIGCFLIPLIYQHTPLLVVVLFIWGGTISGLYTVGLAHLGSRLSGRDLALANSAFVFCYTLGMIVGPQLAGFAMEVYNPHGMIWAIGGYFSGYLMLCLWRAYNRPQ